MKRLLFTLFLGAGFCTAVKAQTVALSTKNNEAVNSYDGFRGFLDYNINTAERVNVNYSFAPKSPATNVHFTVSTANPMHFKASIKDESGKVVLNWKSNQINNAYILDWDISKFKAGNYTLDIYAADDTKSIQQVSFSKQ